MRMIEFGVLSQVKNYLAAICLVVISEKLILQHIYVVHIH